MEDSTEHRDRLTVGALRKLEAFLGETIWGQDAAGRQMAGLLWPGELGLGEPHQPRGSGILLGPTGVGKTEMVLQLARFRKNHGFDSPLFRYDMANFHHTDSLPLLIGRDEGDAGIWGRDLDRAKNQTAILLFDEVEKAAPGIRPLFLAMLDAGELRCADGQMRSLKNHYLFFTSNLASADLVHMGRLPVETRERKVLSALESHFSPELAARFQQRILFQPLSRETLTRLADREFFRILFRWETQLQRPLEIQHRDAILALVHQRVLWVWQQRKLGARIVRQTVADLLQNAFLRAFQSEVPPEGDPLYLSAQFDHLIVSPTPVTSPPPTPASLWSRTHPTAVRGDKGNPSRLNTR